MLQCGRRRREISRLQEEQNLTKSIFNSNNFKQIIWSCVYRTKYIKETVAGHTKNKINTLSKNHQSIFCLQFAKFVFEKNVFEKNVLSIRFPQLPKFNGIK